MARIRTATKQDVPQVLKLMTDFYGEVESVFDPARTTRALEQLVQDRSLGRLLVVEEGEIFGYLALAFGFSLEFGGRDAFLDDLYIAPARRGSGWGTAAIQRALEVAQQEDIAAVHLEVDHQNTGARELYRRLGFEERTRYFLMTFRT